jgi:alkylation response protein AidB-like acyl-CoA dehydrogenase
VPEELGGGSVSGLGVADLAVVAEQRGRTLQPGPFTGTNVLAAAVASSAAEQLRGELLPLLAAGEAHGAMVFDELGSGLPASAAKDGGLAIADAVVRAHEAPAADWLLVVLSVEGELRRVVIRKDTPGVEVRALETFDLTSQIGEVAFAGAVVPRENVLGVGDALEDRALGALLTLVDSVGAMSRLLEMTLDYVRQREAFDRPIGAFQAVKHQVADASMYVHASKAVAGAATEALATGHPDRVEVVSIAKAFVSDSSFEVAQTCLQLHGGIGYAWEHDLHLYLRRLAGNSALYGDAAWHRTAIARRHGLT